MELGLPVLPSPSRTEGVPSLDELMGTPRAEISAEKSTFDFSDQYEFSGIVYSSIVKKFQFLPKTLIPSMTVVFHTIPVRETIERQRINCCT